MEPTTQPNEPVKSTAYGITPEERAAAYEAEWAEWKVRNDEALADVRLDEEAYQGKVYGPPNAKGEKEELISMRSLTGIVESNVAKLMAANLSLYVPVKGPIPEVNRGIEESLRSVYMSLRDDPEAPFDYWAEREKGIRDYEASGTGALEINWDPSTETAYWEYLDFGSIGYHPAYSYETSPVYYVHKSVSLQWLEEREDALELQNMDRVREIAEQDGKRVWKKSNDQNAPTYVAQDGSETYRDADDLDLLIRWEKTASGWGCCWTCAKTLLLESDDFLGIGEHNLAIAMARKYKNKPVGTGTVSMGRGVSYLKDESANLRAKVIRRSMEISGIVTDPGIDLVALKKVATMGGLARGKEGTAYVPIAGPPANPASFQETETYQQELERVTNWSAYGAGLPNQTSDQTSGTASGIKQITASAAPVDKLKLKTIEVRFDTKFARVSMKMAAKYSTKPRWALRAGGSQDYVEITQRLMQAKPQWSDLLAAGVVSEEQVQEYTTVTRNLPQLDPATGQLVEMPATYQDPSLMAAPYVDQDWVFRASLDPETEADKESKANAEISFFMGAQQAGLPVNMEKVYEDAAAKLGHERFSDFLYSPQEIADQQQKAADAQKAQVDAESAQADKAHAQKMEVLKAGQIHDVALTGATMDHQAALAPLASEPAY